LGPQFTNYSIDTLKAHTRQRGLTARKKRKKKRKGGGGCEEDISIQKVKFTIEPKSA
jgi:hypothetical protein